MTVLTCTSYCDESHVKGDICKNRPPVKFILKTNRGKHIRVTVNDTTVKTVIKLKREHVAPLKLIISSSQECSPAESSGLSCLKQMKSFVAKLPLFQRQIRLQLLPPMPTFVWQQGKHVKPLSYCWAQRLTCAFKILQPLRRTWSCSQTLFSLFMWKE